jgi:SAM-dependent methyltransferase
MRRIMFRLLDPMFEQRGYSRVLEAGCGTGHFAQVIGERYRIPVTALDLGREGLEYARHMGLERLVQGDVGALPFGPAAFDLVLSMDVIVHFPPGEETRAMAEFARVLRPGGQLVVRVSALDVLRSRHSMFAHERQRFTRSRLRGLVELHGFRVDRCTYANALLSPVALVKFRIFEPLFSPEPKSGVEPVAGWLDKLLYKPLELESRWIGGGHDLPFGQSLILIATKR